MYPNPEHHGVDTTGARSYWSSGRGFVLCGRKAVGGDYFQSSLKPQYNKPQEATATSVDDSACSCSS